MAKKKPIRAEGKTGRKTGKLVPQPHGGALLDGAAPPENHVPGPGRPPSVIRERLRGSFSERIAILEAIADDPEVSASDRIKAVDMLAKYGLGTRQEVTGEDGAPIPHELTVRFIRPDDDEG